MTITISFELGSIEIMEMCRKRGRNNDVHSDVRRFQEERLSDYFLGFNEVVAYVTHISIV